MVLKDFVRYQDKVFPIYLSGIKNTLARGIFCRLPVPLHWASMQPNCPLLHADPIQIQCTVDQNQHVHLHCLKTARSFLKRSEIVQK